MPHCRGVTTLKVYNLEYIKSLQFRIHKNSHKKTLEESENWEQVSIGLIQTFSQAKKISFFGYALPSGTITNLNYVEKPRSHHTLYRKYHTCIIFK